MKRYLVEFTFTDGSKEEVELKTDNIDVTIQQWIRNKPIAKHKVIEEGNSNNKQMLFG